MRETVLRERSGKLRRWWLLIAALVLGVGWLAWPDAPEAERWGEARRGPLEIVAPLSGQLEAQESDLIGPPQIERVWNFKISFLVPEGSEVAPGQPVLGFDTTDLQRRLLSVRAELEAAEQNLEKRRNDLLKQRKDEALALAEAEGKVRRAELKTDVPDSLTSAKELEAARLELRLAEDEVEYRRQRARHLETAGRSDLESLERRRQRAATEVELIEAQIEAMMVKAPRAGTVIYQSDFQGQKKSVGDSCWKGAKVLEIPDLRQMTAWGEVEEVASGRVRQGQRVRFHLDAHPDDVFAGVVKDLGRTVRRRSPNDPRKVVRLEIALDGTDTEKMRPGMRFQGNVVVERLEDVLAVPLEAIIDTAAGPRICVAAGFRCKEIEPKLGARNETSVEVLDGLDAGQKVRLWGVG